MKQVFFVIMLAVSAAVPSELADVPRDLRQHNWGRFGSCAHASLVTAFRYHGQSELASWWRNSYSGGETIYGAAAKLTAAHVPYSYTMTGDMQWLEWAVRNRLCVVLFHVPMMHCVNLVDMDAETVTLLDNNTEWQYTTMSRADFYNAWWTSMRRSGDPATRNSAGWAIALCLPPPPPWPDFSRFH